MEKEKVFIFISFYPLIILFHLFILILLFFLAFFFRFIKYIVLQRLDSEWILLASLHSNAQLYRHAGLLIVTFEATIAKTKK